MPACSNNNNNNNNNSNNNNNNNDNNNKKCGKWKMFQKFQNLLQSVII